LLSMLAEVVPWASLAEVHLRSLSAPPVSLLHAVFRAPHLAVLHVSAPVLAGMTVLLAAPSASDEEAGAPEGYFPALRKLVAVGVRAESLEEIEALLRTRQNVGPKIALEAIDRSQGCRAEAVVVAASLAILGQDMQVVRSQWT
jgi:hypothetical protein